MPDAAKRTRVAARSWNTRSSKTLSVVVRAANVTFIELKDEVEQFDKILNALDEA